MRVHFYCWAALRLTYLIVKMYVVSSKMLHAIKPSMSLHASTSSASEIGSSTLTDIDEATDQSSVTLSATLHKLHIWEKKLYAEVKVWIFLNT